MKKMATIVVAGAVAAVLLAGCSSGGDVERSSGEPASEASSQAAQAENRGAPLNLDGEWVQTNSESADSRQEAVIEGDAITIYWVSDGGETRSLYWAGTVVEPVDVTVHDPYTWDSVNDVEQTSKAMLASGDDTKTFTYENGELIYEASAMGTTKSVHLERMPKEDAA